MLLFYCVSVETGSEPSMRNLRVPSPPPETGLIMDAHGDIRPDPGGWAQDTALHVRGSIEKLQLQPGDVLVLTTNESICESAKEKLIYRLRGLFPNHRCLVLDGTASLHVVSGGTDAATR